MPLRSLSSIKSTLLTKTSLFCCFPDSKHQTKTKINLSLQWVFWSPFSNYATESSISVAVAMTVQWHTCLLALTCRHPMMFDLQEFYLPSTTGLQQNFWQVPGVGNCTVLCKRCRGPTPLQPPSWSSLTPVKVPLACGHGANLVIMVVDSEAGRHQPVINPRHSAAIVFSYYQPKPDLNCWPRSERLCILLPIS